MRSRTRAYLEGRFGDHYRRSTISLPPAAISREWGYIPWTHDGSTAMVRHRSLADLGNIEDFLQRDRPRHVYFSAGRYDDPAAPTMGEKGWEESDLIFDLDADHLPGIDPDTTRYPDMLDACKDDLFALLSFLEDDFGFGDITIVFSGSRGYHVHVRDPDVRSLGRGARRELVDYIIGEGVELETVIRTRQVAGVGRRTPASQRRLDPDGGWSGRVHGELMSVVAEIQASSSGAALDQLMEINGIGEQSARAIVEAVETRATELAQGNIDVHPAFLRLVDTVTDRAIQSHAAAIDEPVTTDINRLIRLPGSLHGGSALQVQEIDRDALDTFDPLTDAIPETFQGQDIAISVTDPGPVYLGEAREGVESGLQRVPEFLGMHLMVAGRAEKARESAI